MVSTGVFLHLLPDTDNALLAFSKIASPVFMRDTGYILKQCDCCQCALKDGLRFQLFFTGDMLCLLSLEHSIMKMVGSPTEYNNKNKEQAGQASVHFTTSV